MDPATISAIVQLGLKLATSEIERRANKRLAELSDAEALQHVADATAAFHAKTIAEMEAARVEADVHEE